MVDCHKVSYILTIEHPTNQTVSRNKTSNEDESREELGREVPAPDGRTGEIVGRIRCRYTERVRPIEELVVSIE